MFINYSVGSFSKSIAESEKGKLIEIFNLMIKQVKGVIILIVFGVSIANSSFAQTFYSQGSSTFDDVTNWNDAINGSGVSPEIDNLTNGTSNYVIQDTHSITAASFDLDINDFTIEDGGIYFNGTRTITVNGATSIAGSFEYTGNSTSTFMGTLTVETTGSYSVTANVNSFINFHGDLVNKGVFNLAFSTHWTIQSSLSIQNQSASNMHFAQLVSGVGVINANLTILDFVGGGNINFFSNSSLNLADGVIFTNELGVYPATDRFLNMPDLTSSGAATFVNAANAVVRYRPKAAAGTGITYDFSAVDNLFVHNVNTSYNVLDAPYYHLQLFNGSDNINTLQGNLIVNGDLSIGGGPILDAAGFNIEILGDWTNSRGVSGFVNGATIVFSGTSTDPQVITGDTDFNDLVINNTGSSNGVTLNGDVGVSNTLTISNGILSVSDGAMLTFGTAATSIGTYSNTLMVEVSSSGIVRKYFDSDGSFSYPIGTSGVYTPSEITLSTGTSYDDVSGTRYIDVTPIATEEPNVLTSGISLTKYWTLASVNLSNINATIAFEYDDFEALAGNESNYLSGYYNGSTWDITSGTSPLTNDISIATAGSASLNGNYTTGELEAFVDNPSQATDVVFSNIDANSMDVSWTNGTGSNRIVVAKAGSAVDASPNDLTTYTANTSFGSGDLLGTANFVVYNGTGSSFSIDGLSGATDYHFKVFEYNGVSGSENYNIIDGTNNPNNEETLDPFIVTNTDDSGTGSLRWAMDNANASSGETISFNIPTTAPWVISPATDLPAISSVGTILDATTQPSWSSTSLINITQSGTSDTGLEINANDCEIYGFEITGFEAGFGIQILTSVTGGQVGGAGQGNVISGNETGLRVLGNNITIQGNKVGTDNTGTIANSNGFHGISIDGNDNSIGGSNSGEGNLISGNTGLPSADAIAAIRLLGNASGNIIQGNLIGTDITGEFPIANGSNGISLGFTVTSSANNTIIGGSAPGEGNVIVASEFANISISNGSGNVIRGNNIGVNINGDILEFSTGTPTFWGIRMDGFSSTPVVDDNIIGGLGIGEKNIIAGHERGILIDSGSGTADRNTIRGNEIYCNTSVGIELIGTANNNMAPPMITTYTTGVGTASIMGQCTTCTTGDFIDVYRDNEDCTGPVQAKEYLGTVTFSTTPWTLGGLTLSAGDRVTAMVTDLSGNSSALFVASPEINLYLGTDNTGTSISDAQPEVIDFGTVLQGSPISLTFAIENTGMDNLDISSTAVSLTGFSIQTAPAASIGPLLTGTFVIQLDATSVGAFNNRTVTIRSDDADEDPFTFFVSGTVVEPYIVTNTDDSGAGSLRWAIDNANTNTVANTISFSIPDTDANYSNVGGRETWTIAPLTDLPAVTEAMILDGTTQSGTGNFNIILDGQTLRSVGLEFKNNNIEVYGMYIEGFDTGISMGNPGGAFIIGAPNKGNTIVNNDTGVFGLAADDCIIQGNFVGTDENGTSGIGNVRGFRFSTGANNQLIGGDDADERNVISGNTIGINTNASSSYQIIGNYIGTDPTGQIAVANGTGISLGTTSNALVQNNVISGNTDSGIHLNQSDNNTFYGNKIGLGSDDSSIPNGNGITTQGNPSTANGNRIGGLGVGEPNIIANNTGAAVSVISPGDDDNQIIGNSIYCNGSGIVLNSIGNNDIQPPNITSVTTGIVSGTGISGETIHLYRDNDCTPAQGKEYLGTGVVDVVGNWNVTSGFTIVPLTDIITATITSTVDGTSEFTSLLATPEINVYQGVDNTGTVIIDTQPEFVDLETVVQSNSIVQTFAIENTGTRALNVGAIVVSETEYSVSSTVSSVAVGTSETFTITFNTIDAGTHDATVTINSDDADEGTFTFSITAEIVAPELAVFQGATNSSPILSNEQTAVVDFASAIQSNDITRTFTVENTGTSPLNISGISVSGTDYNVSSSISSLGAGISGNFSVTLSGVNIGVFNATVTIASDDLDEGSFIFPIIGTITAEVFAPETGIFVGTDNTGIPLSNSQTAAIDFGSTLQTNDVSQTFAIINTGTSPLNVSNISVSDASFTINSSISSLAAGVTETFTITLSGTNTGEFNAIVTITSDDPDQNEFTFPITGAVVAPKLSLFTGTENTGDPITEDGVINLGTDLSEEVNQSFYIQNTGTSDLIISDIDSSNPAFEIIADELPITIPSNEGWAFEIRLVGDNSGTVTSIISVISNQSTLSFETTGEVNDSKSPPLNVYNVVTPNRDGIHDFLKIENIEFYPDNEVLIFTRSGDKVFETQGYDNNQKVFSGSSNVGGIKELDNGTYYYMINDGVRKKKNTGFFILTN